MIDDITNSDNFKTIMYFLGGGAFVGWFREYRRSRKDAQTFALEFVEKQAARIDKLVEQVAKLEAEKNNYTAVIETLRAENHRLRNDLSKSILELDAATHEITRLKTALGEHGRHSA